MQKKYLKDIKLILILVILGQLLFVVFSPSFTTPRYEGRIYATTGVKHKSEDLHKLNEAAHYFGQTMIGWLKFPHFSENLKEAVPALPADSEITAYIQERQNIIFSVQSSEPVDEAELTMVKNYIQSKINEYNAVSQTEFILTNLDYEEVTLQRSYLFGALVTLLATLVIGLALVFIRRELL